VILITAASSGIGRATALRLGGVGAAVLLVSRTREKLEQVAREIAEAGGEAHVHPCDLAEMEDIERMAAEVLEHHGRVDVLVNNASRSIRRSIELSYDRLHDFERTIQLNYLAPTPRASPRTSPRRRRSTPSSAASPEVVGDGVHITTVHMPLVRTPMIEPTRIYKGFPAISPEEAAEMICDAIVDRPERIATPLGNLGRLAYAVSPSSMDAVLNRAYRLFPDSPAARGDVRAAERPEEVSEEGRAFAEFTRGVHW
jgi:short-subunit dehydrogenase